MSKIICNSVEYVFASTIQLFTPDSITLEPGVNWKYLPVKEKPTYSSTIRQAEAGPIREETVTAVVKTDIDQLLKSQVAHGVVLRLKTDTNKTIHAGSDRFPCLAEISADGITETFTFKSTSIA